MQSKFRRVACLALLAATACGGSAPTALTPEAETAFSFAGRAPQTMTAASAGRASADTLRSKYDLLVITRARMVLRQVTIGTSSGDDCSTGAPNARCTPVMADLSVVDLPLGSDAQQRFSLKVPAGAYAQVALSLVAAPEMRGNSIRVEGTFNGTPFLYEANLELARALVLPRPLVIGWTKTPTNVTVSAPVTHWFRTADGTAINPLGATRGSARDAEVRANIARSLRAFEDRDRDGDERTN